MENAKDTTGTKDRGIEVRMPRDKIPGIRLRAELDVSDVVSVGVAERERIINKKLREVGADIKRREKDIDAKTKELTKSVEIAAVDGLAGKVRDLNDALKSLGSTYKAVTHTTVRLERREIHFSVGLFDRPVRNHNNGQAEAHCSCWLHSGEMAFRSSAVVMADELDKAKAELNDVREVYVDWRKRSAALPAIERQMKAKLVSSMLESSEDGKKLIAEFNKNIDEDMEDVPLLGHNA